MLKKEAQEIKLKLKNSGYETSKADNFMYRVGFKTGYKIALQHLKKRNKSYTTEIMKELRQEQIKKGASNDKSHYQKTRTATD